MRKINNFEQTTPTPIKKLFEKFGKKMPDGRGYLGDNRMAPMNTSKIDQMMVGESIYTQEMVAQEKSQATNETPEVTPGETPTPESQEQD